jgi:hypothetical protein
MRVTIKAALQLSCLIVTANISLGQDVPKEYFIYTAKADSLYQLKAFRESAFSYSAAFKTFGWKALPKDRYNAGRAWALAGYSDSAFFNLNRIALAFRVYYSNYDEINADPAFSSLHSDKRWLDLLDIIKANQEKGQIEPHVPLAEQLAMIYDNDQKYRKAADSVEIKYGRGSAELQDAYHVIGEKDFFNLIKVKKVLDTYGWLGADSVGVLGNEALFLVIQHADNETQEKYFPMIKEAVKTGKVPKQWVPLFMDRLNLSRGEKQIYGSQVKRDTQTNLYYLRPLDDPDNVDKRRAECGLQPLADYLKMWNITWDIEKYKRDLAIIESKEKSNKK